jgi:hypothetical protein
MKKILGFLLIVSSIIGGLYVGGWLMFVLPIINCCKAFDMGTLTGLMVGIAVLKCIFASFVGWIIAYIGITIGGLMMGANVEFRLRRRGNE